MNSSLTLILVAGVVLFLGAGFLFFSGTGPRKPKKVIPANQKRYHEDETLEGPVLTKVLGWSLIFTFMLAAALPLYWLTEPQRQVGFAEKYNRDAAERGKKLFADAKDNPEGFGCATCHGGVKGGATRYVLLSGPEEGREVTWTAPALDDIFYRFSREQVHDILVFGRPNTPMPAWGLRGGGPMTEQMLNDVISYLESIQTDPEAAKQNAGGGQGLSGQKLFEKNCARCHTQGWSYRYPEVTWNKPVVMGPAGGGSFGPNLRGSVTRQFYDPADQVKFVSDGSQFGKPYGQNGVGTGRMPGMGKILDEKDIMAIVEYERSL